MDHDVRRRTLQPLRVLCDGCERAIATVFCSECREPACSTCAEQLHGRGRRSKSSSRTCKGNKMSTLDRTVAVMPMCKNCKMRPAARHSNGDAYPLCRDCRNAVPSPQPSSQSDVVNRAFAEELSRSRHASSSASGRHPSSTRQSSSSRQPSSSRQSSSSRPSSTSSSSSSATSAKHKSKRDNAASSDSTAADDTTKSSKSSTNSSNRAP